MQRASILAPSLSSITSPSSIQVRSYNRRAFNTFHCTSHVNVNSPFSSLPGSRSRTTSFISHHHHLPLQNVYTMRHISSSGSPHSAGGASKKTSSSSSKNKRFGSSFATKAFVATATASTSYAAYYCATAFLFSSAASVNGESTVGGVDSEGKKRFHEEKKTDDRYGIQYAGFDSYPGIEMDDGTGVSTEAFKAASVEVVARALEAAGLDEKTGIMKGITIAGGNDITLDPKHAHRIGLGMACPSYGCPFLPMDVHYDEEVKVHLENMRKGTSSNNESDVSEKENTMLKTSGSEKAATLTLIGYKGGRMEDQINQDRALALAPYSYWNINSSSPSNTGDSDSSSRPIARLIGAFDGHAKYGEKVSEYVAKTLPALLGSKLVEHDATMSSKENKNVDDDDDEAEIQRRKDHDIGRILHETFLELDATSPAHPSGGCTASAVLQVGTRIYIANAGDSRSFVGVHVTPPTAAGSDAKATTAIVFGTREDKAHLMKERERVEHMGGTVYLPNGFMDTGKGTTRVLYKDPTTGSTSGLAMSRSIGDWDAGAVGVIPDPLVDILDTKEIKKRVLESLNKACGGDAKEVEIDPASGESLPSTSCVTYTEKNVKVFAVSATDGLLDYLPEEAIVNHVAKGLYETTKVGDGDSNAFGQQKTTNPLLVCEDLIYAAAQGWQEDKGGRYRDDIAIAMTDLETE